MELDHLFIFTETPDEAAKSLREFGFAEGTSNTHPGQGTACKRFFFNNAYLELVWVTDEEEIKSPAIAKTKLWERSKYRMTNYCPFGLCFRSEHQTSGATTLFQDAWQYKAPYLPNGFYIDVASNADFISEPMLFELSFQRMNPKDYPLERQQPLNHKNGFEEITKVILTLPHATDNLSAVMKTVTDNSIVSVSEGENYSVALEFDHGRKGKMKSLQDIIPLTLHW